MKRFIFLILFLANFINIFAQDTNWVAYKNIELPYKWEILNNLGPSFSGSIYNIGNVTVSFPIIVKFTNAKTQVPQTFWYSLDTFKTWHESNYMMTKKNDSENYVYFITSKWLFPNHRILMATDTGYFIETTDFGKTYTFRYDEQFKGKRIQFTFKDSLNGFLLAFNGTFSKIHTYYTTSDGGYTWNQCDCFPRPAWPQNDYSEYLGYITDDGTHQKILKNYFWYLPTRQEYYRFSKDDGKTWTDISPGPEPGASERGFYLRNDSIWYTGSLGGYRGEEEYDLIYLSPDLGRRWIPQVRGLVGDPDQPFTSIEFYDNSPVGFTKESMSVLMTFNGGNIWTPLMDSIAPLFGSYSYNWEQGPGVLKKYLMKLNNQMIFFGNKTILKFVPLGPLLGVNEETKTKENFNFFYNPSAELIEVKSGTQSIIDKITIYDMNGRVLYSDGKITLNPYYINAKSLDNAKVVFAVIQAGNYVYFEKIMCE
ncbi:MAG: hypothetical protein ABFD61_04090 [Chloroherpetonaceae bacterium]